MMVRTGIDTQFAPRGSTHRRSEGVRLATDVPWALALAFVAFVTLSVRVVLPPSEFADFETYVEIASDLAGSSLTSIWPLEPLSRGLLLWSTDITGRAEAATIVVHWLNSLIFLSGIALLSTQRKQDWPGMLLVWGLYGALLGFVTLRATPAYLLVAYAALRHWDRPLKGGLVILLASGFHASALLMLPPLMLNAWLSHGRNQAIARRASPGRVMWVLFCICCYSAVTGGIGNAGMIADVLLSNEITSKYAVYADFVAIADNHQSLSHRVYFIALAVMVCIAAISREDAVKRIWPYVAVAFLLTALASASPVVAFRLSLFWTIPLLMSFPWSRWTRSELRLPLFTAIAVGLFIFGVRGALAPVTG
jgi:hypothetical protein